MKKNCHTPLSLGVNTGKFPVLERKVFISAIHLKNFLYGERKEEQNKQTTPPHLKYMDLLSAEECLYLTGYLKPFLNSYLK